MKAILSVVFVALICTVAYLSYVNYANRQPAPVVSASDDSATPSPSAPSAPENTKKPVAQPTGAEAMFGLYWGMTVEQVESYGVSLSKQATNENLEGYLADSLPKKLGDAGQYWLYFSDGKLVKVAYSGENIISDFTGREGKEKFEVLAKSLEEKYGVPTSKYQYFGRKLYDEYDEFYQCLGYYGCGGWMNFYKTTNKYIKLELKGVRRGEGYLELGAEAIPEWGNAVEKNKAIKNKSNANAL
jgi:hypothetical protein